MIYYHLPLRQMPELAFAHRHRTNAPQWRLEEIPGLFQVAYIKAGRLLIKGDVEQFLVPAGGVVCLSHAQIWQVQNLDGEHIHYTVAFYADPGEQNTDAFEQSGACLPRVISPEKVSLIFADIQRLIALPPEDRLRAGIWILTLLCDITEGTHPNPSGENHLCYLAKKRINSSLEDDIRPSILAEELGVSYGHLSRVFRQYEKMTLTAYICHRRLDTVRNILSMSDMTLKKAGESVGFYDEKYLSRLFHKIYGISARDYMASVRKNDKER